MFNLLPGTPLDGGRLLHGLVCRRTGDRVRATHTATSAEVVLGAVVAGAGLLLVVADQRDGLWLALVGWFLARSASEERMSTTVLEGLVGLAVRDV